MKKLLIISMGRLRRDGAAGNSVTCALIESALEDNFKIEYVGLEDEDFLEEKIIPFNFKEKYKNNIDFNIIPMKKKKINIFSKMLGTFNQSYLYEINSEKIIDLMGKNYENGLFIESLPVILSSKLKIRKKLIIFGDPAGERLRYSNNSWNLYILIKSFFLKYLEYFFIKKYSKDSQIAIWGTKHSKDLGKFLNKNIYDIRPFLSTNSSKISFKELNYSSEQKIVFNFGGTLATTASKQALKEIKNTVLPSIRNCFKKNEEYEFKIIGEVSELYLSILKNEKNIKFTGRVNNFEVELSKGDVFILPMNYPVGVRTRLCSALAAGNICIVHNSILGNMPELKDCQSVFIVNKKNDYYCYLNKLKNNHNFFPLKQEAIKFFNQYYRNTSSTRKILDYFKNN